MVKNSVNYELFDLMHEIIIVFDIDGQILYLNSPAKNEFGIQKEQEVESLTIDSLFPSVFRENKGEQSFIEGVIGKNFETVAYRKNQTCFETQAHLSPIPHVENIFLCSAVNKHEMKELKKEAQKAEHDAKTANEVRNEFVANVTHELRTPVNGIKGHVKYLLESVELNAESRDALKIVERCCENMEKIINNLLDFSKMEAGKFLIEEEVFSLKECVDQVIATNIKQANEKGIELDARVSDDIPEFLIGDELRISQILNNLISNAVKFTAIGKVKLEILKTAQYGNELILFIMVIDTGIGIAPENLDKLFKSFSQVDGSITRKFGGTGLGLTVTKNLVEMMGGKINVDSTPGKGSTFTCSIRLHTREEEAQTSPSIDQNTLIKPDLTAMLLTDFDMGMEKIYQFGSAENKKEIKNTMDKLVLCMEMETWNRAEEFADNLKQLVKDGGEELVKQTFRLSMCVRKENYQKSMECFEKIQKMLFDE